MSASSFDVYVASLAPVSPRQIVAEPEPEALERCVRATAAVMSAMPLNRSKLVAIVEADPDVVPVLAAAAGLSQERLKTWLVNEFDTAGWKTLARARAAELVEALDERLDIVELLNAQAARSWTWADVLARVMSPRQRAGSSVQQGRDLEDKVEEKVRALGVPYEIRTRFVGKAGATAPADFAIPTAENALIAVAVKGFDSTGSKLTDATREIEQMVEVSLPRQFIFAVVDGLGWKRRQGDLRRIHGLWADQHVHGLFTQAQLDAFGDELKLAARRVDLIS